MKINSVFYGLTLLAFSSSSIFHLFSDSSKSSTSEENIKTEIIFQKGNPCTETTYQVSKKTAEMWEESWKWDNGLDKEKVTHIISFSKKNLDDLRALESKSDGLRMYYCFLSDKDSIPALALVNMVNCNDALPNGNNVLLSDENGGHFISSKSAVILTDHWRASTNYTGEGYVPINGYNYSWQIIDDITGLKENTDGKLYLSFGQKSISSNDPDFKTDGIKNEAIAVVNILHGAYNLSNVNHTLNFTMPCPKYCDNVGSIFN